MGPNRPTMREGRIASGSPPWNDAKPPTTEPPAEPQGEDVKIDLDILARITVLYGKVLDDKVLRDIAALETEYPRWHVWPAVSYPDNGLMYAKRDNTAMNVIRVQSVAEAKAGIDIWLADNPYAWGSRS